MASTVHYLDDFLFVWKVGSSKCALLLVVFRALCGELVVPLAENKTKGPVQWLMFWGTELDLVNQCSR